jgi:hypothetical protein
MLRRLTRVSVFVLLSIPATSEAVPIVRSIGGSDHASIQATVDEFRVDLASPNSVEISWDGGGSAASTAVFPTPMTLFNLSPTARGTIFTTSGSGFEISGQPSPHFGDLNPTYPDIFTTFSTPRLFTALGSNVLDVYFFLPGTNSPAVVRGFGAVFTDVDIPATTMIEYFDTLNSLLFTESVEAGSIVDKSLSFLGVSFTEGSIISKVRITTGTAPFGPVEQDSDAQAFTDLIKEMVNQGFDNAVDALPDGTKGKAPLKGGKAIWDGVAKLIKAGKFSKQDAQDLVQDLLDILNKARDAPKLGENDFNLLVLKFLQDLQEKGVIDFGALNVVLAQLSMDLSAALTAYFNEALKTEEAREKFNDALNAVGKKFGELITVVPNGNISFPIDIVALDDFVFGEPQRVPQPSTLLLAGVGLAWLARTTWRRYATRS